MRAVCVAAFILTLAGAAAAGEPLRRFVLPCGDRLFGRLVSVDERHVVFESRFGLRHEVHRGQCLGIAPPDGVLDFDLTGAEGREAWQSSGADVKWVTDDERGAVAAVSPPFAMQASLDKTAIARVAFGWHAPADARGGAAAGRLLLDLAFAGDAGVADGLARELSIAVPLGEARPVQAVNAGPAIKPFAVTERPARPGWRDIVVLLHAGRLRVLVDGEVCVAGDMPGDRLQRIGLRSERVEGGGGDAASGWKISRPQLQRPDPDAEPGDFAGRESGVETVVSAAGDEVFGRLASSDSSALQLSVGERTLSIPWSDVRRLMFAAKAEATAPVSGLRARLELAPPPDQLPQRPDFLTGAILSESPEAVTLSHPVLGRIAIPSHGVKRINRLGRGILQVLDSSVHHLGDEVRSGFRRPRPEGTALEGRFTADTLPAGARGWLCFEVVDVEPCAPDAPKGTPFLAELRAGALRTEATLNGTPLGDLNSHLTYKAAPSGPQHVRIPFRTDLLKAGENVWRLKQRPARGDDSSFDDCEIGPVTLEIDLPESAAKNPAPASEASR